MKIIIMLVAHKKPVGQVSVLRGTNEKWIKKQRQERPASARKNLSGQVVRTSAVLGENY